MTTTYVLGKVKKMAELAGLGLTVKAAEVEQKLRIDFIRAVAYGRVLPEAASTVAAEVLAAQKVKFDRGVFKAKVGKTNHE